MHAEESISVERQGESVTVRSLPEDHKRLVSAALREVHTRVATDSGGYAEAGPWQSVRHRHGVLAVRNLQVEHWEQAHHWYLPDHGRHHWEAESTRLWELFLQGVEKEAHFSHLLCPWTAHGGRHQPTNQLSLWHVLLAHEYEQRKSKCLSIHPQLQLLTKSNLSIWGEGTFPFSFHLSIQLFL